VPEPPALLESTVPDAEKALALEDDETTVLEPVTELEDGATSVPEPVPLVLPL
jgi:hypothetical protein